MISLTSIYESNPLYILFLIICIIFAIIITILLIYILIEYKKKQKDRVSILLNELKSDSNRPLSEEEIKLLETKLKEVKKHTEETPNK